MQLVRRAELARRFGLTGQGFSKMVARVGDFPARIKVSDTRQSGVFFDLAEVEQWLKAKKEAKQ